MRISRAALPLLLAFTAAAVHGQSADLGVEKLGPSQAPASSDVSYSLTVFNAGPDAATGVVFSDPIPAGMSLVTRTQDSGPAFSCDTTISCTIPTLLPGVSATFTFVFHIDSGTDFLNVATVSSSILDPNSENDQAVAFTAVALPQGDLSVAKSAPPSTPPDADVTFLVMLANGGPDAAENVVLTDNLPAPLTFVSLVQDSGPPMSCGVSTCTLASFPAGATATFSLTGHVPPGTPGGTEITNIVSVSADNDPSDENDVASATVIVSSADVRIEKTGPPAATAGTTITYQVTVTNDGPDTALNVNVDDPQLCPVVACGIGLLGPGGSVVLTGDVPIPSSATSWSNTAVVTTNSFDPDLANNTATVPTTLTQSADVSSAKTGPATVVASTDLTYSITVANDGPSDASDVVLTDTLPAGTTFVSSSCGANPCALGTLAAGTSVVVTLVANVDADSTGPLLNTAAVASSTPDPSAGNNESTAETAVTPAPADLSVAKTADATVAPVGSNVTYSIVVTNLGPGVATDVVVTDVLPAGTTLVSSPASCSGTTTVTCALGTLAASSSTTIDLLVTLPATPGPVSNSAGVGSSSTDPGSGNDSATVTIAVQLPPLAVPTLSSVALVLLGLSLAWFGLVVLRRAS
jgi:uncharacterized repeat protein (TIGR01451 family)